MTAGSSASGDSGTGEGSNKPSPVSSASDVRPANPVDLHTHSTASDGLLPPAELVRVAAARGVAVLGLTDHDSVAGLAEATAEGDRVGIEIVPGVELGTSVRRHEVHLLGYFVDPTSPVLLDALAQLATRRRDRAERMVELLGELGVPLSTAEVFALAGTGSVGRPHVARALVARGAATDVGDAFDRYLAIGRPAYVPRQPFTPEEAVGLIRAAGGVPVLAHPLTTGDPEGLVERLKPVGLGGLEVYYGEYGVETQAVLLALANRHDLIPTGGSDFHGEGFKHGRNLGGPAVPFETVQRLRCAPR